MSRRKRLKKGGKRAARAPLKPVNYARNQARGTASNARDVTRETGVSDFLPWGIRNTLNEIGRIIPYALGKGSVAQQLSSVVVMALFIVISSPLTGFASLVLLIPLGLLFVWGLLRLIPAVNSRWGGSILHRQVKKDREVPGWRRK